MGVTEEALLDDPSAEPQPSGVFETELRRLSQRVAELEARQHSLARSAAQEDKITLLVFSNSLDRLLAAFTMATGAAAMGTRVSLFFTFWGTAALRRENVQTKKSLFARLFGWMLPKGSRNLPLSQLNMGGMGPLMMRRLMKQKGVASLEEMLALSRELGVNISVCSMSMDLLGFQPQEMIEYPNLTYCGVATFLERAATGKMTLFV